MAITVEVGAGDPAAVSYASVLDADDYLAAEADADWAALGDGAKERALVLASRGIDGRYGVRFVGAKLYSDQGLAWPRNDAIDTDGFDVSADVPHCIVRATIELARKIAIDAFDVRAVPDPGALVKRKKVQAGAVVTEVEYTTGAASEAAGPDWRRIDDLLRPVTAGVAASRLVRV